MLTLLEESQVLAVSLKKAKNFLRLDHTEDDEVLKLLIRAATSAVEQELGRSLIEKIWQKTVFIRDTREGTGRVTLPFPPLVEILSVEMKTGDDGPPVTAQNKRVLSKPSESGILEEDTERKSGAYSNVREHLSTGSTYQKTDYEGLRKKQHEFRPMYRYLIGKDRMVPTIIVGGANGTIRVRYKAGYGDKASMLPPTIRQAILILVSDMYENRTAQNNIPANAFVNMLLAPYRIVSLA